MQLPTPWGTQEWKKHLPLERGDAQPLIQPSLEEFQEFLTLIDLGQISLVLHQEENTFQVKLYTLLVEALLFANRVPNTVSE